MGHLRGEADLLRAGCGGRVVVEGDSLEVVDGGHAVAGPGEGVGEVGDALTYTEDGREEQYLCHVPTVVPGADSVSA